MYDPLHDHLTILEFSGSLDVILEALVTRIEVVGGHIEQRTADITRVRKDVDILIEDEKTLEAEILVVENTHSDVSLKYQRIHKQVLDIEGMWPGLKGAHGSLDARIVSLENQSAQAFIDVDVIQKDQTNIKIDVTNIENDVVDLSAEIDSLDVRISKIQGREADARDQIKILIARIAALEQSSQSAQASIISAQNVDVNIQNQINDIRVQVDFL